MSANSADRPLATFALFAFNQEAYVCEAVEAAFAQTYCPLQIILSDDCSTDKTYTMLCQMAAEYDGPHQVLVRRNDSNLGLAEHINSLVRDAAGEVIVMAAGDDISMPDRTTRLMELFEAYPDTAAALSDFSTFPAEPAEAKSKTGAIVSLVEILVAGGGVQKGATYAYRKKCFVWPYPLPKWLVSEDRILPLRAALLGSVRYSDQVLVRYRRAVSPVATLKKNGRLHGYNHPLHFECLRDHLREWKRDLSIPLARYLCVRFFLGWIRITVRLRSRPGIAQYLGAFGFLPVRAIRKVAFEARKLKAG